MEVSINKQARLSEHLTSSSVATLGNSSELDCTRLSPHFTLGELCKTSAITADGNIPSHVHIENMKRLCGWLEMLRSPSTIAGESQESESDTISSLRSASARRSQVIVSLYICR